MQNTWPNKARTVRWGALRAHASRQAVFYTLSFFWLDGFAVPAPARSTQTVGQFLAK
ncbi:MAG: hypothetical protein IPN96_08150 [Anaerolineales bacterium]|nr:hypothetical protein [Anaerolineales bacterium]